MATVITHKQFPNHKVFKTEIAGRPFSIEVGKTAELANAAMNKLMEGEYAYMKPYFDAIKAVEPK